MHYLEGRRWLNTSQITRKGTAQSVKFTGHFMPRLTIYSLDDDTICYGMTTLPAHAARQNIHTGEISPYTPVFVSGTTIISKNNTWLALGSLETWSTTVLKELISQPKILMHYHCSKQPKYSDKKGRSTEQPLDLLTTLYGPPSLADDVSNFLQKCQLFLQDPKCCEYNVPYQNPQYLIDLDAEIVWTHSLFTESYGVESFETPADLLTDLASGEKLPEAPTPTLLRTQLFR